VVVLLLLLLLLLPQEARARVGAAAAASAAAIPSRAARSHPCEGEENLSSDVVVGGVAVAAAPAAAAAAAAAADAFGGAMVRLRRRMDARYPFLEEGDVVCGRVGVRFVGDFRMGPGWFPPTASRWPGAISSQGLPISVPCTHGGRDRARPIDRAPCGSSWVSCLFRPLSFSLSLFRVEAPRRPGHDRD
jgi:hypothetical protein